MPRSGPLHRCACGSEPRRNVKVDWVRIPPQALRLLNVALESLAQAETAAFFLGATAIFVFARL